MWATRRLARCRASASPWLHAPASAPRLATLSSHRNQSTLPPFADQVLRGSGQVLFLNHPGCGGMLLGALGYGDPWLGVLATLGTASSTATARALGVDSDTISAGLMGYNGCLVGCAFSVFLGQPAWSPASAAATALGAAATVPLAVALKPLCGSVPQFTLAFNIATLAVLGTVVRPLADAAPADPTVVLSTTEWLCAPLVGISQIFVVNDAGAGAMTLGAIALYSPACAVHALLGSCTGIATGLACGAPPSEIGMGLWGFNPALTALAVSVFFVPGPASYALATGGAAATALCFAAAKGAMASAFAVPALTLPFCTVASACHLLPHLLPNVFVHAAVPHSPERNTPL